MPPSKHFNRRRREREFEHYFEPFAPHAPAKHFDDTSFTDDDSGPVPSIYPGLFNLALLACLRYNVRRTIITLVSHDTQYVVAEATRFNYTHESDQDPQDGLIFGHTSMPRDQGLCLPCISETTAADCAIPDLQANDSPDLSKLPKVILSNVRAYFGVPIHSPAGYAIGVLGLLHDEPCPDITLEKLDILRQIAGDVSRHIADMRTAMEHARHVRMVHGISALVAGKLSIRSDTSTSAPLRPAHSFAAEGQLNQERDEDKSQVHMLASEVRRLQKAARPTRLRGTSNGQLETPGSIDASNQLGYFEDSLPNAQSRAGAAEPVPRTPLSPTQPRSHGARWSDQAGIDELFARATNIIRESMEVEGVVILSSSALQRTGHRQEDSSSGEGEESYAAYTASQHCSVAGFSTSLSSSVNGDSVPEYAARFPSRLLQSLVYHFPVGKLLHPLRYYEASSSDDLDDDELSTQVPDDYNRRERSESSSPDSKPLDSAATLPVQLPRAKRLRTQRRVLMKDVLAQIEGAHSMLYHPMWDTQNDSWYAAVFAWTQRPTRVFSQTDLDFLSAFATNVMTEVAHLQTLNTERIKSKFVSTISHELRSPLHGLMGCTEALQQTSLTLYQSDMLSGVRACATSLMGTVNNLLDHARISHMQDQGSANVEKGAFPQQGGDNATRAGYDMDSKGADLTETSEEIVQSCVTGFEMSNYALASMQGARVIVDIQHSPGWHYSVAHGAWTRIIANLVDNALKFTKEGFVFIRSTCSRDESSGEAQVRLEISDTGVGMSKAFVQQRLYTAFVQEDPQSSGTGLGLSIVHHVVTSMGGQIEIDSEQGRGTAVLVTVPASCRRDTDCPSGASDDVLATALACSRGLRVALLGFETPLQCSASTASLSTNPSDAAPLEAQVLENMLRSWFNIEVIPEGDIETVPDIVIHNTTPGKAITQPQRSGIVATVSVCSGKPSDLPADSREHHMITRPIGVRKFARALAAWTAAADRAAVTPPAESPEEPTPHVPEQPMIEQPKNKTPSFRRESSGSSSMAGTLVLAVDDNPLNLKLLVASLKRLHIKQVNATNGAEAVSVFREHRDVITHIFMDISMPVMDGLEATRQIRRIEREFQANDAEPRPPAKIIALTGLGSQSSQDEARQSGVDVYLTKPAKLAKLREVL